MSTDPDGSFAVQASFALPLSTPIGKDFSLIHKNAVRDQLFEVGILLHLISRTVAGVRRIEQRVQVGLNVWLKALKMSHFLKEGGGDNEDMLNGLRSGRHERAEKGTDRNSPKSIVLNPI